MCMVDQAEDSFVADVREQTARVAHTCGECGRTIEPGERYRVGGGVCDGEWWTGKMCVHCWAARSWLSVQCNGWLWGGVLEDLEEHWQESPLLRSHWLGRAILGMRRRWRGMPPPAPYTGGKVAV